MDTRSHFIPHAFSTSKVKSSQSTSALHLTFYKPRVSLCIKGLNVFLNRSFSFFRDIQQESLKGSHSHLQHSFSFMNNHYLFLACFMVVVLSILLYLLRLRRIHHRSASASVQWLEEGLGSPDIPVKI